MEKILFHSDHQKQKKFTHKIENMIVFTNAHNFKQSFTDPSYHTKQMRNKFIFTPNLDLMRKFAGREV